MKKLPKTIELQLLAVDFKDTDFCCNEECAISKAIRRQLDLPDANITTDLERTDINFEEYEIEHGYYNAEFTQDQLVADKSEPETVIRTIKLTKI